MLAGEVVKRAYSRAVSPSKLVSILKSRSLDNDEDELSLKVDGEERYTADDIAAALLERVLPRPCSLSLAYLSQALSSSLLSPRTFLIHLLFYLSDNELPIIESIGSIAGVLLSCPTSLQETDPLPSLLSRPLETHSEDALKDSLAALSNGKVDTLSLLLPFLRLSTNSSAPSSVTALTAQIVSILSPFPPPSLDVALEAGNLLPMFPEEISGPLRNFLGSLMADLTQDGPMASAQITPSTRRLLEGHIHQNGQASVGTLPLKPTIALLLEHAHRAHRWTQSDIPLGSTDKFPRPSSNFIRLLKAGRYLTSDREELIKILFEVSLERLIQAGEAEIGKVSGVRNWGWAVEGLPLLLRWWHDSGEEMNGKISEKGNGQDPLDIVSPLKLALQSMSSVLQTYSQQVMQAYGKAIQSSEVEGKSSGFNPPVGWQIITIQEYLIGNLVHLGLLTNEEAATVTPEVSVISAQTGESLIGRITSEPKSHLEPLIFYICYAYRASFHFTTEILKVIQDAPQVMPPENLLLLVSSHPCLLSAITTYVCPPSFLQLTTSHLLSEPAEIDNLARSEDPQGYLTKFGEGIVLIESFVREFELRLPNLLVKARRAVGYDLLSTEETERLNRWVKAIFGSDGIEDQLLLATPPQALYILLPTLVQQALAAVAYGQIDLDILHSGLSYFSQPFLSWCLGGVIGWLCCEIVRLGALSTLHLIVLQALALGDSCPPQLLRVNNKELASLLDPSHGLQEVVSSSNFNITGLRSKLESQELLAVSGLPPQRLAVAVQSIHDFPIASPEWPRIFFDSISASLNRFQGAFETLRLILTEAFTSSFASSLNVTSNELYKKFVPLLLSLDCGGHDPLARILPLSLPDAMQNPQDLSVYASNVAVLIKDCVSAITMIWGREQGLQIVHELVEELAPDVLSSPLPSPKTKPTNVIQKNKKHARNRQLNAKKEQVKEEVLKGLQDDEEFNNQWSDILKR
nr:hypothetical protein L203_01764 [Cryptococcus depauperatus CBS 7841]